MSPVTVTTTTTPETVVCSGLMAITMTVTLVSISVEQTTLVQHDVVLLPQMILRETVGSSAGLTTMPWKQQPQSQMSCQDYANYSMVPPQLSFSFRVEPSTDFLCHVLVSVVVFTFFVQFPIQATIFTNRGTTIGDLQHCIPLDVNLCRHICLLVMVFGPHQEFTEWVALPLL